MHARFSEASDELVQLQLDRPRVAVLAVLEQKDKEGANRGDRRGYQEPVGRATETAGVVSGAIVGDNRPVSMLRGQLLIASPTLLDPNFRRTVVLVAEHGEEGAMGIVLNRVSEAPVVDAVPQLAGVTQEGARVHVGGPVQAEAVVVVAEFDDSSAAAAIVFEDVGFMSAEAEAEDLHKTARRVRVFAGYAGWGAGQLDAELADEDWILEPAEAADVFSDDPEELWSAVLRRKGGKYALVATMPPDSTVN